MMQITEDTPPDMLAGAMDLTVHLPTGRVVKMSVERSTPMMDLLVQITTAHHLQQSGHILQALAMAPTSGHADKILPYKPNSPIGVLDIQHVKVVAKNRPVSVTKNSSSYHQPFESTFRLQVHLPRNQLYVIRVSQNVFLADIMRKVCDEKKLDMLKYEFRHPGNLDEVLDPKLTLSDYQITEVYLVSKGTLGLAQAFSSNDIMALRKEEERKQLQARTGGGVFSLIFKRGKANTGTGSLSSENRSISPSHSDDSRSITPPAVQQQILPSIPQETIIEKPKPPMRKRRPAPKPPQQTAEEQQRKNSTEKSGSHISNSSDVSETDSHQRKSDSGLTICHSRNSSDSSGYHEPSVLSDHCNTSLPRRPKGTVNEVVNEEIICKVNGNLTEMATFSKSAASITGRKKKAAPLPPPLVVSKTEKVALTSESASPVVDASVTPPVQKQGVGSTTTQHIKKRSPQKPSIKEELEKPISINSEPIKEIYQDISSVQHNPSTPSNNLNEHCNLKNSKSYQSNVGSFITSVASTPEKPPPSIHKLDANIKRPSNDALSPKLESAATYNEDVSLFYTNNVKEPREQLFNNNNIPNIPIKQIETDLEKHQSIDKIIEDINDIDWEYQIAPPPTEFRDASPVSNHIELETKKLNNGVHHHDRKVESDCDSAVGDDIKPMLNTLTLENLEKRKSLVYNREISTSLKFAQENISNSSNVDTNDMVSKRSSVLNELEEVIQSGGSKSLTRHVEPVIIDHALPNFKIATYAEPKTKISIFEDDTIRSKPSEEIVKTEETIFKKPYEFNKCKTTSRTNFYVKHQNNNINSNPVIRSESFSMNVLNWKPLHPVQRSKSQVALNKLANGEESKTEDNILTKSSSLFDVSGLQSLEVMRVIQNKLNTPSNSAEELDEQNKTNDTNRPRLFSCKSEDVSINLPPKPTESTANTKTYQYQGPPAVNLSTWSERPKTKISLKEDTDYRISTKNININNNNKSTTTVKINGTEPTPIHESSGNVVIKISETHPKLNNDFISQSVSQTTSAVTYRKPLANINTNEKNTRPHSVAYTSDFDIPRVPFVRAVELKKSVTQITNDNNNRYSDAYYSSEINMISNQPRNIEIKPVQRVNSFAQNQPQVLGFRGIELGNDNTARSRKSWNVPSSYSTLPSKVNLMEPSSKTSNNYTPNSNVPFSQLSLKRVEITRTSRDDSNVTLRNPVPHETNHRNNRFSTGSQLLLNKNTSMNEVQQHQPPPPPMPQAVHTMKKSASNNGNNNLAANSRDELLSSIRNFGGSKGLRHVKV